MNDSELAKRIAEAVSTLREWNPLMHPNWEQDATAEICKVTAPLESELRQQVEELRTLLKPFAEYATRIDDYQHYEDWVGIGYLKNGPTVGDCRKARSALAATEPNSAGRD